MTLLSVTRSLQQVYVRHRGQLERNLPPDTSAWCWLRAAVLQSWSLNLFSSELTSPITVRWSLPLAHGKR